MYKSILLVFFYFTLITGFCQLKTDEDSTQKPKVEVILKNGEILRGGIKSENPKVVVLISDAIGEITLSRSNIMEIRYLKNVGTQKVFENLKGRYFFSPSAINMKKGEGYYQNTMVLLNGFYYAFTDNITIGGGLELLSLISRTPIFFIAPKISYDASSLVHFGAGMMHINFSLLNESSLDNLNLVYGTFTYGEPDLNCSFNVGANFGKSISQPLYTICGFARMTPKFGLMTENWVVGNNSNNGFTLFTLGGRIIGRKNLFDFGLITNKELLNDQGVKAIPFVSYTLKF